ncbi:MAG: GNAT family N-acetyltransferase [Alphaproteobacteria bacterium]|nr:GNAT family N-acetyltransferase [Alphaproteobacteria bacterium]
MSQTTWTLKPARIDEIESLNELIRLSARGLSEEYTQEETEALIQYVFGVDQELIHDKTYFVIQKDNVSAACGGWSKRPTLFGGDQCETREKGYLDPLKDAAKIRAFFVHPHFVRQGLAKTLLNQCEQEAVKAGFKKLELMSTLPGIKFYRSQGYEGNQIIDYTLPNKSIIHFMPMRKQINDL